MPPEDTPGYADIVCAGFATTPEAGTCLALHDYTSNTTAIWAGTSTPYRTCDFNNSSISKELHYS